MLQTLSKLLPIFVVVSIVEPKVKNNMYIESVQIEENMNSWFNPQKKGWLAGDVGHSIPINNQKVVCLESEPTTLQTEWQMEHQLLPMVWWSLELQQ